MNSTALATKARALLSLHMNLEDYKSLSALASVANILDGLDHNHRYHEVLESLPKKEVHRDELESKLRLIVPLEYLRLSKFAKAEDNPYLWHIERDLVINKLYALLKHTSFEVNRDILEFNGLLSFDIQNLRQVQDIEGFLALMRKTVFASYFQNWQSDQALWLTEIELCIYTYDQSRKRYQHNKGLVKIIDLEFFIEVTHLLFHLYIFDRERAIDTLGILPNHIAQLPLDTLKQWIYSSETSDSYKDRLMEYMGTPKSLSRFRLKQIYNYHRQEVYTKILMNTYDAPTLLYAYTLLNEIEVELLIRIIENVRYQVPKEEIFSQIIVKEGI